MKQDELKPSLKKNIVLSLLIQIVGYISPLIVSPYISRVLGPEQIGIYSFSYTYAHYFVLFVMFGFLNLGSKLISSYRTDFKKRNEIFWTLLAAKMLFALVAIAVYLIFIFCRLFKGVENYKLMFIFCIFILSAGFDISFFFQGIEKLNFISITTAIVNIWYVISIFLFVKTVDDLLIFTLLKTLSYSLIHVFLWSFVFGRMGKPTIDKKNFWNFIRLSFIFFLPTIVMSVSGSIDETLIGLLSTKTQVAYYEQVCKITTLLATIISAVSPVLLSRISLLIKENSEDTNKQISNLLAKGVLLSLVILTPLVTGLYIIGTIFVPLFFGSEFIGAIPVFMWLLPVASFSALSSVIISGYYYPFNKANVVTITIFITVLINVSLTALLLYFTDLGAVGAAIPSLVAEFINFVALYIGARKKTNHLMILKDVWKVAISAIIMATSLILLNHFVFVPYISSDVLIIVLDILIGGILYSGSMIALKEMLTYDVIYNIKNKFIRNKQEQ